jgi:DNA-binding protein Fis
VGSSVPRLRVGLWWGLCLAANPFSRQVDGYRVGMELSHPLQKVFTGMGSEDSQKSIPRRQIARLIGSSILPMVVLSEEDIVVFVNEAFEKLVGLDGDRLIGLDCSFLGRSSAQQTPRESLSDPDAIDAVSMRVAPPTTWSKQNLWAASDTVPDSLRLFVPLDSVANDSLSSDKGCVLVLFVPESKSNLLRRHSETSSLVDPLLQRWFRTKGDEPWYLAGGSLKSKLLRTQIAIAKQSSGSVAIIGIAGRCRDELVVSIHRARVAASANYQPSSMVTIDCRLMDNSLLDSMFEVIEETVKSHGTKAALLLSGLDLLPKELLTSLDRFLAEQPKLQLYVTLADHSFPAKDPMGARLWLRLSSLTIPLPSVRERLEDLEALIVAWFQDWQWRQSTGLRDSSKRQVTQMPMSQEFKDALFAFPWYGDLDELSATLEHAMRAADGQELSFDHLPVSVRTAASFVEKHQTMEPIDLDSVLESIERKLILEAIERCKGNRSAASKLLNISRARMIRRLQQWGIAPAAQDSTEDPDSPMFEEIE